MRVFITGATGQVGSHLVEYLLNQELIPIDHPQDIFCLVREPQEADFLVNLGVSLIHGDLDDRDLIVTTLITHEIHHIFHLAANVYVYASYEDMYKTNVLGTQNMLDAFVNSSAKSFIYASSIVVYDHHQTRKSHNVIIFNETSPLGSTDPKLDLPYAVTKRQAEQLVQVYAQQYPEKSFLITRLGPIIGSRDRQMIPSLAHIMSVPLPKLIDHGNATISLTAPVDVARAQVFLVRNGTNYSGQAFNIAHQLMTFRDLFEIVSEYYHCDPPKVSIPLWVYRMLKPLLKLIRKAFKKTDFIQTLLSPSALDYMEYSYEYSSQKLKDLGFSYSILLKDSILEGLLEHDPTRRLMKKKTKEKQKE